MSKVVDHTQQREQILAQCYELFAREGYAAITLRRLSKELGVSTGALYHYFDSKEEIFEQTVAYIARRELTVAVAEVSASKTRQERLQSLTQFLLERDEQLRLLLMLIFDVARQNSEMAKSGIFASALETYVEAIVTNLPEIPREDAHFAVDMLLGAIFRRMLIQRDDDFVAHIAWLAEMVDPQRGTDSKS